MSNPNNCDTCKYLRVDEGWCYMFRKEPDFVCYVHSGRNEFLKDFELTFKKILLDAEKTSL